MVQVLVCCLTITWSHYSDVIMNAMASQITSVSIVCSLFWFRGGSKKTSKIRVTGLCEGNPHVTGGFPSQMASNAENVSNWWRHHVPINWIVGKKPQWSANKNTILSIDLFETGVKRRLYSSGLDTLMPVFHCRWVCVKENRIIA